MALEPGCRRPREVLQLEDLPRHLAAITALAFEHRVLLSTLVTDPATPPRTPRTLVVRVQTMNAEPFVAALRAAGIHVDAPARGTAAEEGF